MANMRPSWPLPKTPMTEPGIIGLKTDFTRGLNHASQPLSKRGRLRPRASVSAAPTLNPIGCNHHMHPPIRSFTLICLVALTAITAQAEPRILWVKVLNLKDRPVRKISVGAEGSGSSALTDDRGMAGIRLSPQSRPGTWVTLEAPGGDYVFVSPWNRKVPVPALGNELENFVTVYLTAKGDREALESGRLAT